MLQLPINYNGGTIDPVWNTRVKIYGPNDDLPVPDIIDNLYLDFETTSQKIDKSSVHPFHNCKILGVAFLFDNEKEPGYIPVRHAYLNENGEYCYNRSDIPNVNPERVHRWLELIFDIAKQWVNHNIKYDAHVYINETGKRPRCKLIDSLNLSKLAAFEERFSYGLDEMLRLIGVDITPYEKKIHEYLGKGIKDYGLIPPDWMAIYAGVDVLAERKLVQVLREKVSKECYNIVDIENDLLPVLIDIEQRGVRTNPAKIIKDWMDIIPKQRKRVERLKKITGMHSLELGKKKDLYELFQERLGWTIDYTEGTKEKIAEYGEIPDKDVRYAYGYASIYNHVRKNPRVVGTYLKYQEDEKLLNGFIIPYVDFHIDNHALMHGMFNQIVRTGRMSMREPNLQQLPLEAKEYIVPWDDDYDLVEFDLSQIEFRMIVHYIGNRKCIEDFNNDPKTDFHTWVANMCGIDRKPAKNINFMLGYGGGKGKCIAMLRELPQIIGTLRDWSAIEQRAISVYESYHKALPELKPTQWRASDVLRSRGYVRTILGRHRYLPKKLHYKSFNSVCQGSAADFQKYITLRLRQFFSEDCILHALVHDSWLFSIKRNRKEELVPLIHQEITRPIEEANFSVPIKSSIKSSSINWRHCSD